MADKNIEKKTTTTTNNTAFKPLSEEELAMVTGGEKREAEDKPKGIKVADMVEDKAVHKAVHKVDVAR